MNQILQMLTNMGILSSSDISRYICVYNNRANINLLLYDKLTNHPLLFLKISDLRDFNETFNIMGKIHKVVPDIIPEPLCVLSLGKFKVLVTRAYQIELLAGKSLFSIKKQTQVIENSLRSLIELYSKTSTGTLTLDRNFYRSSLNPLIQNLLKRWQDEHLFRDFQDYLKQTQEAGDLLLPRIPQHGDLVMFNTGIVNGNLDRIIFLDWDSYSMIQIPIYDLITFLVTFSNLFGQGLYVRSRLTDRIRSAAMNFCHAIEIDPMLIKRLYPICFICFAGLKLDIGIYDGQIFAYRELKRFFSGNESFIL